MLSHLFENIYVRNIIHGILDLYPCRLQSCHERLSADTVQRKEFGRWVFSKIEQNPTCIFSIL